MKKSWEKVLASCFLGWILVMAMAPAVQAQTDSFTIGLALPNEGETFYAGPSSLLYNIPIEGWVKNELFSPTQISVEISIYQNTSLVTVLTTFPDSKGVFRIYATVNPGAYVENFAAEFIPCGDVCHVHPSDQFSRDEWNSSLDLPPGPIRLVATATDPDGRLASAERNFAVDRSAYAIVPVQIELIGDSQQPVENIPITGSTWLYMWRSRFATGGTDSGGIAQMKVEALAEAPTRYRFQVMPSVVNGVFYESLAPVEIVLPPGVATGPPVTLRVRASLGVIRGRVNGNIPSAQAQVWAIHMPDGCTLTAPVSPAGSFVFEDIAIGEYVVTMDPDFLAAQGFENIAKRIDLAQSLSATTELNLIPLEGRTVRGTVTDIDGNELPFAWISAEKLNIVEAVLPNSGEYGLYGMPPQKVVLIANAPGYYSQAQVIDPATGAGIESDFELVRRPETRSVLWGDGEIIVPSETHISLSGDHIFLERGWLWGQNPKAEPLKIQTGQMVIDISSGAFAIEDVPGQPAWLYLFSGSGTVTTVDGSKSFPVQEGQMMTLDDDLQLSVVPFDPVVVKMFHSDIRMLVSTIFQPTILAQISNRLALIGIDLAKLVTFITYTFIIVSTILLPVVSLYWWLRQRNFKMMKRGK